MTESDKLSFNPTVSNGHLYFWIRGTKERLRSMEWEGERKRRGKGVVSGRLRE